VKDHKLERRSGLIMLACYVIYFVYLLVQ